MEKNKSTITGGLGIEESFFETAINISENVFGCNETISDAMLDAAKEVRNESLGELEGVEITSYEKKLILVGYICGIARTKNQAEFLSFLVKKMTEEGRGE